LRQHVCGSMFAAACLRQHVCGSEAQHGTGCNLQLHAAALSQHVTACCSSNTLIVANRNTTMPRCRAPCKPPGATTDCCV
jgi:hypothetical protein